MKAPSRLDEILFFRTEKLSCKAWCSLERFLLRFFWNKNLKFLAFLFPTFFKYNKSGKLWNSKQQKMFMSSFIQYILLKDLKGFSSQELCQGPQIISNTKFDCWWLSEFFFRKQKFLGAKLCVKNGKNWWSTLYMKEVLVAKLQMELQYGIDAFHSGLEFSFKKVQNILKN